MADAIGTTLGVVAFCTNAGILLLGTIMYLPQGLIARGAGRRSRAAVAPAQDGAGGGEGV